MKLRKPKAPSLALVIEEADDLLCMLLGKQLLFGQNPQVSLDELCPGRSSPKMRLLSSWVQLKHIEGTLEKWNFTAERLADARKRLNPSKHTRFPEPETPRQQVLSTPTVSDIVRAYKKALGALRAPGKDFLKQRNMVSFFRYACKVYDPQDVLNALPGFFNHQAGSHRYGTESLSVYLKAVCSSSRKGRRASSFLPHTPSILS